MATTQQWNTRSVQFYSSLMDVVRRFGTVKLEYKDGQPQ